MVLYEPMNQFERIEKIEMLCLTSTKKTDGHPPTSIGRQNSERDRHNSTTLCRKYQQAIKINWPI